MRALMLGLLLSGAWLGAPTRTAAYSVQEAILRVKPAVVLITTTVGGDVTLNCGLGPVTVTPAPYIETGTGWFVDGRGYVITNAHVVDPAHRLPPWVTHELKKKAIDQACVEPKLKAQGLMHGVRPEIEEGLRLAAAGALAGAKLEAQPQITVMLSNGVKLEAKVQKFSAPPTVDSTGKPTPDSGRDLALLRVQDGIYPAIGLTTREVQIGDPVHILGFPGVVLSHELLNQSVTLEASVTNGAISGFKQDAIGQDVLQSDAPAAHGNSGGPAIRDDASLVGVLTFVSLSPSGGAIVQGFNFLIPARDVLKFLADTPVKKTGESAFNVAWEAGLDAFFRDRDELAVQKIQEANRLVSNLADVKRTLAEAEDRAKHPRPRPFPWAWTTFGVSMLSVGTYGGMWGRRWWRNRFRVLPAQVIGFIENGRSPLLVDVRTKTDYETSPLKLPGAVRLDPDDAEKGRIPLDAESNQLLITYCTSPEEATSARFAHLLRQRKFSNVRILKGGLGGWTNARLPVEAKSHLPSIGLEIYKNLTLGDVERRRYKAGETIFREGEDAHAEAY